MRLTAALASLLVLHPSLISALPSESHWTQTSTTPYLHDQRSSWRRLSDSIIRKVWSLPEKHESQRTFSQKPKERAGPSGKLIATYGQDVVLRFNLSSVEEATSLAEASNILFLDVWEFNENWVDIRIAKDVVPSLLGLLPESLQKSHIFLMQDLDLAQAIFESFPSSSSHSTSTFDQQHSFKPSLRPTTEPPTNVFFSNYQPLSVIQPWMNLMASMFSTHVRRINIGISYEGRDIPALRVGVHPTNDDQPSRKRKTVLVMGGSHAREWVSTSSVNYLAWSLITDYGKDAIVTRMLEQYDWVFIPTINPDGYVYSWETDRLWRKNRQPTSLRFCRGLDLDRSFDYKWDGDSTKGNPCSESYAGDQPFEAVESKRFAEWAKNETEHNNVEFVTLLDLHSYSQQILYPYSYTCDAEPPTVEDLAELALGLAKAIRLSPRGHYYEAIPACEGNVAAASPSSSPGNSKTSQSKKDKTFLPRMETGGGSALDWFYHEMQMHYSFQIKLRDTGSYGFLLPKEHIVPTGKELKNALMHLGRFLMGEIGVMGEDEDEEFERELKLLQDEMLMAPAGAVRGNDVLDQDEKFVMVGEEEIEDEYEEEENETDVNMELRRR